MLLELFQWGLILFYIYSIFGMLFDLGELIGSLYNSVQTLQDDRNPAHSQRGGGNRTELNRSQLFEHNPSIEIPNDVLISLRLSSESNCTICTEPLESNLTVTHCNHTFHSHCLNTWTQSTGNERASCPICRTTLNTHRHRRNQTQRHRRNFRRRDIEVDQQDAIMADPDSELILDVITFTSGDEEDTPEQENENRNGVRRRRWQFRPNQNEIGSMLQYILELSNTEI